MSRRGFTLLELILATGIAAMLALSVYTAMSAAYKARGSAITQMSDIRSAAIALDLIEQDLQSLLPPRGTLSGPMTGYALGLGDQEADSVEFYCIGGDRERKEPFGDGFRRVQIILRTDTAEPTLVRRVRRNLLAPTTPEPEEEVLATGVIGFSLRYYDGYGWYTEWDSLAQDNRLPLAIEATVRVAPQRNRDATQPYTLTRLIRLSCGQPGDAPEDTDTEAADAQQ